MADDGLDRNGIKSLQRQAADLRSICLANEVPPVILQYVDGLRSMLEKEAQKTEEGARLTAQVSIYPLRQASLSPAIGEALNIFQKHGLEVKPGSMSTLIAGAEAILWKALRNAFYAAERQGETVMIVIISNACPWPPPDNG